MKKVVILGVPLDLGAGRRGVDMGPSALRVAEIAEKISEMGHAVEDRGNISVPMIQKEKTHHNAKLRYLEEIYTVNEELAKAVKDIREEGSFPLILGGDHSIAIGSIAGMASEKDRLGVIWIDAHGDFNTTETTPSGNIHGMPLAASVGLGESKLVNCGGFSPKVLPQNTVLIGIRQLDDLERTALKKEGMPVYSIADVDQLGMHEVIRRTLEYLDSRVDRIHLSFDMDVLCPEEAPGVGTPVKGGLTYREAHLAMELLSQSDKISSMDLVEVNPTLDEKNKTAELAVELVMSALGKRIF